MKIYLQKSSSTIPNSLVNEVEEKIKELVGYKYPDEAVEFTVDDPSGSKIQEFLEGVYEGYKIMILSKDEKIFIELQDSKSGMIISELINLKEMANEIKKSNESLVKFVNETLQLVNAIT